MRSKFGIFCISLLCFIIASFNFLSIQSNEHEPGIKILTAEEIQEVITNDADHYYEKFHKMDFVVRNVKNKTKYLDKISQSGCTAEDRSIGKVRSCIKIINKLLFEKKNETILGINLEKLLKIPWKIGFTCDRKYENGLPHTRGDVIILNNKDIGTRTIPEVCKLLIHEKCHVYQKKEDMSAYLKENYTEVKRTDETSPANPDTDDYIYRCNKTNIVLEGRYTENPKHFRDVHFTQNDHSLEHPFENIAYEMENLFDGG